MANFKDSYRIERVYFEKLKSMIGILKSFLENENNEELRAILSNEIDDNGAILLLYRNLGEAWAELADLIQKLRNDLTALDEKEEAYHDELNERIDEVNNYLMALIRALEARMDAVEADLAQMGRLFTYDLTEASGVYSLTESGASVTFADTVSKLTHVRPHFVSVRNGSKYYLIDTYDLTAGTGAVTWSGFEFTSAGEIKETIVTLAADNSVTVTQTSTNFASILSRLTAIETKVTNFGDLPSNANANEGDVLTVGEDHVNIWKKCDCLPPITYNDIGKVLGVIQDGETDPEIVENVIVPVTNLSVTDQPVAISGVDASIFSGFENGDTVYFLINNKRIAGQYQQGTFYCEDEIEGETVAYQIIPQGAQHVPYFISYIAGPQMTVVPGDYAIKLFTEESVTYPVPAYEVVAPPYMYGPYLFTTSDEETLLADGIGTVYLDSVYSYNEETQYEFPTDSNCKFYYYGHVLEESAAKLNCRGVELPLPLGEDQGVSNPVMWIENADNVDRTLSVFYARLYLYTSVELEVYEG